MTQKQTYSLTLLRNQAYEAYLEACIQMDDTPREFIVTLIRGCNTIEAMKTTVQIIKSKNYKIH